MELVRSRLHIVTQGQRGWDKDRDPLWRILRRPPEKGRDEEILEMLEAVVSLALSGLITVQSLTGAPPETILDALAVRAMGQEEQGDIGVNWDIPHVPCAPGECRYGEHGTMPDRTCRKCGISPRHRPR